MKENKFSYQEV